MIKEFRVENFLSFATEQRISFEATSDTTSEENLVYKIIHPKTGSVTRLLRMAAVYGANASGKTNLLLAIEEIFLKLFHPKKQKDEETDYTPFALLKGEMTKMAITFFIGNVEYQYEIEYDEIIRKERLRFNPNGVMSLLYERGYDSQKQIPQIMFGDNASLDKEAKMDFVKNTLNNHSVLSTFGKISIYAPVMEKIYDWLRFCVKDMDKDSEFEMQNIKNNVLKIAKDPQKKDFFLNDIDSADFNISDVFFEEAEVPIQVKDQFVKSLSLPEELAVEFFKGRKITTVSFEHKGTHGKFNLPIGMESKGTLKYIGLSSKLFDMVTSECIYLIDEIERAVHYDLLTHFMQKFILNEHGSQLIFTTHDQHILDEDFIRRDMVWFASKDKDTSSTELFSAADFNLHKNVSIYKAYKVGKLGAKPELGSPFIHLQNE